MRSGGASELIALVEALEEVVEVAAGVAPVDRLGGLLPVGLEGHDARLQLVEVVEVAWGQRLALEDREVDLDLVQPRGVDGEVDEDQVRPGALQAVDGGLA